jgi:SNF2 family DNA or RNA helicase
MSTESVDQFEALVASRMKRFNIILEKAQFQFKQYQHDGVEWCVKNELRPNPVSRGGFIADEMGLGKTIMMIGTMFVNYLQRTLIVVPSVLIQQWHKDIFSASGHKALLYYGEDKKNITLEDIERAPIVLTTYNSLFPSQCLLKKIVWSRVIFDEAHHLRNCGTIRFKSCKQIKARVRWLVTGTPIQNNKFDFYNLCSAAGLKPPFYTDAANFRTIGKQFVLRRTKATVGILLPPVCKNNKIVKWKNKKEMMLSEEIHALLPNQTFVSGAKRRCLAEAIGSKVAFVSILRARQSCVLPSLLRVSIEKWLKKGLISSEYLEALEYTSKLDAVIELIVSRKDNGKGKIIFCHYHGEIDIIAQKLVASGLKKVVTYDGRNSGGENLATLAEPADALVIQIQTGCEGLNLQHNFSEIYFVSPHWNPCVEDQAIARCHRIGQVKTIDVFKFEMCGFAKDQDSEVDPCTLEKYVNKVQDVKREISRQILEFNL